MSYSKGIEKAYELAKECYAGIGVDADTAIQQLTKIAISLHCWQGDDVGGFESNNGLSSSGLIATGNYPGRARTAAQRNWFWGPGETRSVQDQKEEAMSLTPEERQKLVELLQAGEELGPEWARVQA